MSCGAHDSLRPRPGVTPRFCPGRNPLALQQLHRAARTSAHGSGAPTQPHPRGKESDRDRRALPSSANHVGPGPERV